MTLILFHGLSFFMILVFNFFCSLADTLKFSLKENISTSLLVFKKQSANIGSKISLLIKTKYVIEVILSLGFDPIFLNIILTYLFYSSLNPKFIYFLIFFSSVGISVNNKLWFIIFVFCIFVFCLVF